eukprot:TRINITY_DN3744_c0_g1_i2.p2 TRINITY_DN3744_c0_g1~~TRINITY_DN3744_c0_g1_i2.p2  ORF type:complete len:156 (-),score=21.01 TRINITY_DN3744_c0_g1_i2:176-643(-)
MAEEPAEQTEIEEEKKQKSESNDDEAFCPTITTMVLSIFGFNVFVFLYSLFALITWIAEYPSKQNWLKVTRVFYYIALIALIVFAVVLLVIAILGIIRGFIGAAMFYLVLLIINLIVIIFMSRSKRAVDQEDTAISGVLSADPNYKAVQLSLIHI